MDKIELKDVKKQLPLKGRIVAKGKYACALTKEWFNKLINGSKKMLKKTKESIDAKIEAAKKAYDDTMQKVSEFIAEKSDEAKVMIAEAKQKYEEALKKAEERAEAKKEERKAAIEEAKRKYHEAIEKATKYMADKADEAKAMIAEAKQKYDDAMKKAGEFVAEKSDEVKTSVLPDNEAVETLRKEQIQKLKEQRWNLKQVIGSMENDDDYRIGVKNCYLKEIKKELRKLDKKQMKVSKKGLGIMSMAKLSLQKLKENIKNKWAAHKEKVAERKQQRQEAITQKKQQKEENMIKQRLVEIMEQQARLNEEKNELMEQYPGIYAEVQTESKESDLGAPKKH